jgi:hypothetical protein
MSRRDEQDGRRHRAGWWLLAGGVAAAVALAGWVLHYAARTAPGSSWLLRAVGSPMFLTCAAVLLACAAGMAAILAVLWRAGRPYRARREGQEGVAILEFALALPFLLMLALLMTQTSLLMVGNVCVHYAAFCAARCACVTIPKEYGANEPRNQVNPDPGASGKLNRIRMAAMWALMPVSCGSDEVDAGPEIAAALSSFFSLQGVDPPGWIDDRLARKLGYASAYTEVELDPPDDGDTYGVHEDLKVTLRHTLYLSVPYAAKILAQFPGGVELDFGEGEYGTVVVASCSLPNEGVQDYVDIEEFPRPDNE